MGNAFSIVSQLKQTNAAGQTTYQSLPNSFTATQTNANGPSPGMITATTGGVNVSLAQLAVPALCRIMNTDTTNYVTIGTYVGSTFTPFLELQPGESFVLRLSRSILSGSANLRAVGNTASVNVLVECFDQ